MSHLNEEQLVLFYYGEAGTAGVEEHLGDCESCRAAYQTLQRVLNSVDSFAVPERPADYEARVWRQVDRALPRRTRFSFSWKPLAAALAAAALLVGAFFLGRSTKKPAPQIASDPQVRERVLLVAVGDHLERSQMVLVELANAGAPKNGSLDISYEQQTAEDLIESNRLYRTTAASDGDVATAALLEDLERVLLEIVHSPSAVTERQLDELRKEINDRGILFKVKVFGTQVEQREAAPQNGSAL
jgi:hypothetical protein